MSDAQTILKMIEDVSPDDTAKLDEIDARVWCWLMGYEFVRVTLDAPRHPDRVDLVYFRAENPEYNAGNFSRDEGGEGYRIEHSWNDGDLWWAQTTKFKKPYGTFQGYTRSRDALKAIRPEGWTFSVDATAPHLGIEYCFYKGDLAFTGDLHDEHPHGEELAELHAIIQAIAYERGLS